MRSDRLQHLLRELAPQVLGSLVRRFRDFSACEDAVQEALLAASLQWPKAAMPENPRGWLIQVAARRLTDRVRADAARRHREELVVSLIPPDEQLALAADAQMELHRDDSLDLLLMCCHPALSPPSAVALTLRAVGGLTTAEIARAYLVPEATLAQRISRAKQTLRDAGERFELPRPEHFRQRLDSVMQVLYLIFNEGYVASSGSELLRADLYGMLLRMEPNPMVALNEAIAYAMVHGAEAGLERLDAISADPRLAGHYRLDAVRGHLHQRAGNREHAILFFRRAAERTASVAEREYLRAQAARLAEK